MDVETVERSPKGGDTSSVCSEPSCVLREARKMRDIQTTDRSRKFSHSHSPSYRKREEGRREESCCSTRSADDPFSFSHDEAEVETLREAEEAEAEAEAEECEEEVLEEEKKGPEIQVVDAGYGSSREGSPGGSPLDAWLAAVYKGFTDGCDSCSEHARKGQDGKREKKFTAITMRESFLDSCCFPTNLESLLDVDENGEDVWDEIPADCIAWFKENEEDVSIVRNMVVQRIRDKYNQYMHHYGFSPE